MDVLLDVVSDERDPIMYPNPNDYLIKLNRNLYNVTNIRLLGAQIPLTQSLINNNNNTFSINGQTITLENGNYDTGEDLASELQSKLDGNSNVSYVSYNSNTEALTFSNVAGSSNSFTFEFYDGVNGYSQKNDFGTPADILGFNHNNQSNVVSSNALTGGVVNLTGPTSLVIRLTTNSTDLSHDVYNVGTSNVGALDYTESVYFGRLLTEKYDTTSKFLIFSDDYPIQENFIKGPEKSIEDLRIRFYYTIGSKLVPYDFGMRNHTLKFQITCSLDKLSTLEKQKVYKKVLPPPVKLPSIELPKRFNKRNQMIMIFAVLLGGLLMLLMLKQ